MLQQYLPFTVLKQSSYAYEIAQVNDELKLQQYLPFTVLKPHFFKVRMNLALETLQQYLPFTVLKLVL